MTEEYTEQKTRIGKMFIDFALFQIVVLPFAGSRLLTIKRGKQDS